MLLLMLLSLSLSITGGGLQATADWPEFRGPRGDGHAEHAMLPTRWSAERGYRWQTEIPGNGWSSPVVAGETVYLTTAVEVDGETRHSLQLLMLELSSGRLRKSVEIFREPESTPSVHKKNSHASPTPIVTDRHVFVHFGHEGTACLTRGGEIVWKVDALRYRPVHGNGGSPLLVNGQLIFSCDGGDVQFIVALDADDGSVRWRTRRETDAAKKFSFSTPVLIAVNGQQQLISPGSNQVSALDPDTGRELWRVHYDGYSVIPKPVYAHGLLYVCTGYNRPTLLAIRPPVVAGSKSLGDVSDQQIVWSTDGAVPHTSSLLLVEDRLFMISDRGVASCLDAQSGKIHWQERLGGNFSASPLLAQGLVYFTDEAGKTTIVEDRRSYQRIASNEIGERCLASMAAAGDWLLIRGERHLFCVE